MGNGINGDHWWAKGAGADMELGRTLEPLAPFRTKLNVINGLFNRPAVGVGIHPGQTGNILSGMPLRKGAVLHGGISMDQLLANHVGQDAMQPSMVLGCEQPITGYHETNFSMAYSSHISWQTCLLYLSNMWSGERHDNTKLPVLTLGGLGGGLVTGRVMDFGKAGDENRKLCSLHLSIMDRMGVKLPRFGDADTRLAGV